MRTIPKKVDVEYFEKILSGEKTYEVRLADFEASEGDILWLREIDSSRRYTGRELKRRISYCFNTKSMERYHTREELEKYGLLVMGLQKESSVD